MNQNDLLARLFQPAAVTTRILHLDLLGEIAVALIVLASSVHRATGRFLELCVGETSIASSSLVMILDIG